MLSSVRKFADSFIIRILLGVIIFAFIGWGIKDVVNFQKENPVVTFTNIENITEEDFLKARSEEISILQRQSNSNLSEEEIKRLEIDKAVLQRLISDRVLTHIIGMYNLNLSEDAIINFVKQSPIFRNDKGEFDIQIFQSMFKDSAQREEEYLAEIEEKILKNTLVNILLEGFQVPDSMVSNVVGYLAERRNIDLVEFDLKRPLKNREIQAATEQDLLEFYQAYPALFTVPEMRSFLSILVLPDRVAKKVHITNDELTNFYNENKDEFEEKDFNKAKKEVTQALEQQKVNELMIEFIKNLEDDVAAGLGLKEISEKYELPLQEMKDISYSEIMREDNKLSSFVENIFEMEEGEVLYPTELQDKEGFWLAEMGKIKPSRIEEFAEVRDKAHLHWNEKRTSELNLKKIEDIASKYKAGAMSPKEIASLGLKLDSKLSITRSEIEENDKIPSELLIATFETPINSPTPVFKENDKAYFAYIKQIKIDNIKVKALEKSYGENIKTNIKNGVLEELINSFIKRNNVKITLPNFGNGQ